MSSPPILGDPACCWRRPPGTTPRSFFKRMGWADEVCERWLTIRRTRPPCRAAGEYRHVRISLRNFLHLSPPALTVHRHTDQGAGAWRLERAGRTGATAKQICAHNAATPADLAAPRETSWPPAVSVLSTACTALRPGERCVSGNALFRGLVSSSWIKSLSRFPCIFT